jgi:hypothetical protein
MTVPILAFFSQKGDVGRTSLAYHMAWMYADVGYTVVAVDLAPNLGAINRAALIASDHLVVPVTADRFSVQGLEDLGSTLQRWKDGWLERVAKNPAPTRLLPPGEMHAAGYDARRDSEALARKDRSSILGAGIGEANRRVPGAGPASRLASSASRRATSLSRISSTSRSVWRTVRPRRITIALTALLA